MSKRFDQLDSLRGIAAMTVVFNHFLNIFPAVFDRQSPQAWLIIDTPLHMFWAGHEAVMFFFVLSGFVLSLPFHNRQVPYRPFVIKRICRIYMPYFTAVALALIASVFFSRGGIGDLSTWFNHKWVLPITAKVVVQHLLLIDSFPNGAYNPVLWSLVHEMRISLLFPLLMLLVGRTSWKTSLGIGIVISGIGFVLSWYVYHSSSQPHDYYESLQYMFLFIVGALLAKHRAVLIPRYQVLSKRIKYGLVFVGVLCYTYAWWLLPELKILHFQFLNDLVIAVGVSIFIITSLSTRTATNLLTTGPLLFAGRISYSVFLLHAIFLLTFINLFYGELPMLLILVMTLAVSLVVSWLAYRFIEEPSMKLGRDLAGRLEKRLYAKPAAR